MAVLLNRRRVWGSGCCPIFRTRKDVEPSTPPAAAGGTPQPQRRAGAARKRAGRRPAQRPRGRSEGKARSAAAARAEARSGPRGTPPAHRAQRPRPERRKGCPPTQGGPQQPAGQGRARDTARGTGPAGAPQRGGRPGGQRAARPPSDGRGARPTGGAGRTEAQPTGEAQRSPERRRADASAREGGAAERKPEREGRALPRIPLLIPARQIGAAGTRWRAGKRAARVGAAPREAAPHGRPASTRRGFR